ncbi:MAG: DUF3822 family protein [Chlorobi bacterium]|nr:DUF3822 family protein [Chlorobiota bacterium]
MNSEKYYRLSIQAGLYGLSFFLAGGEDDIYRTLRFRAHHPVAVERYLKEILHTHRHLFDENTRAVLIHHHNWYTWVPEAYFDETRPGLYIRTTTPLLETDTLSFDRHSSAGRVNVYIPMVNLNNLMLDYFPEIEFYHSATLADRYAFQHFPDDRKRRLWVRSFDEGFQLGIWEGRKMLFFNSFPMETTEDFLYYFFFAWEKTGLKSGEQAEIMITGTKTGELTEALEGFAENIRTPAVEKELLTLV